MNAAGPLAGLRTRAARVGGQLRFRGSGSYWRDRYASGGSSGAGSYGVQAQWKADVVNGWVESLGVRSVVDLGCGDGNQLSLARYPRYLGLDVSPAAVQQCAARFAADDTKSFLAYDPSACHDPAGWLRADLALSMEVLFHLVEPDVFATYLAQLFASADRYVVICARDAERPGGPHERYRPFTPWVAANAPQWQLTERVAPPAGVDLVSELFLFSRRT
ncbi:MAG: class I SAM-dependent methyltransferase [Actinomycetales bacterium]